MSAQPGFTRIASLKTPEAFRAHAASLGLDLPCDDAILVGGDYHARELALMLMREARGEAPLVFFDPRPTTAA